MDVETMLHVFLKKKKRISFKFVLSHFYVVLERYKRQMDVKVVFCCYYKERKKAHKSVLVRVQNVSGFSSSFECYGCLNECRNDNGCGCSFLTY